MYPWCDRTGREVERPWQSAAKQIGPDARPMSPHRTPEIGTHEQLESVASASFALRCRRSESVAVIPLHDWRAEWRGRP